jgi:hypothetical protein
MLSALVLNVFLLSVFPVQNIWGDESEYIRLSHREQSFAAKVKRIVPGFMYFEWWPPFAFGVYGLLAGPAAPLPVNEPTMEDDEVQKPLESVGAYSGFFVRVSILNLFLFLLTAFNIYYLCILSGFGKITGVVASGLFLFNPRTLFYVQALWPELLHLAMLSGALLFLILYDLRGRYKLLILSGVLFGFCSLTKGIVATFLVVLLPILVFRAYRRSDKNAVTVLKIIAVFYGCFFAVNLPQKISNYATHQMFSTSMNRWVNIELGFIPYQEFKVDLHKRYRESSDNPVVREELAKRRAIDYIKSSSKLKLLANQANRFVFKQLNRSFLLLGLKRGRWTLSPAFGYTSVLVYNIAIMLSWFVFLFGICGLILYRLLSFGSAVILIYTVLYLFLVFLIVHSERFFMQAIPFLGIFAAAFLTSVKWRAAKN